MQHGKIEKTWTPFSLYLNWERKSVTVMVLLFFVSDASVKDLYFLAVALLLLLVHRTHTFLMVRFQICFYDYNLAFYKTLVMLLL